MVEQSIGAEKTVKPRRYWLRVGGLLMAAGLAAGHATPEQKSAKRYGTQTTATAATSHTPTSVKAPILHEERTNSPIEVVPGLKSFESFQQRETVSRTTIEQSYQSVLRLESKVGLCTGSVINKHLVTAGHCTTDDAKIRLGVGYGGRVKKQVRSAVPVTDLLVATTVGEKLPTLTVPKIVNDNPLPGTRLITTTFPANSEKPILGSLTFLYEQQPKESDKEEMREGRKWVLAVGPDNSKEARQSLCNPAASGSTALDSHGHVGVLTESISRFYEGQEEWENAKRFYETVSGVNLHTASAVCLATPLDRATFDAYARSLDAA